MVDPLSRSDSQFQEPQCQPCKSDITVIFDAMLHCSSKGLFWYNISIPHLVFQRAISHLMPLFLTTNENALFQTLFENRGTIPAPPYSIPNSPLLRRTRPNPNTSIQRTPCARHSCQRCHLRTLQHHPPTRLYVRSRSSMSQRCLLRRQW